MDSSLTIAEGVRLAKKLRHLLAKFLPWPWPRCLGGRRKGPGPVVGGEKEGGWACGGSLPRRHHVVNKEHHVWSHGPLHQSLQLHIVSSCTVSGLLAETRTHLTEPVSIGDKIFPTFCGTWRVWCFYKGYIYTLQTYRVPYSAELWIIVQTSFILVK